MQGEFRQAVYDLVVRIPHGRVMTYGDIAAFCGRPLAARQVGGIAHFGPSDLPWHRVVNRFGGLASGYYGGESGHAAALAAEGVVTHAGRITNFEQVRWTLSRVSEVLSMEEIPLIVITGPTASGKTGLAVELAKQWGGEIICADSRTVYRDMNIGTAKPSPAEQGGVRHWLLDIAVPGQRFTAVDFQRMAKDAIADIRARGKIPFLVGGTGLYIDAVVLDFVFGPEADFEERKRLEKMTNDQLKKLLLEQHIPLPRNAENRRHLVRALERKGETESVRDHPLQATHVIAIKTTRDSLRARIHTRIEQMFANEIVQETQQLLQTYGTNNEAMTGNIYRIITLLLAGEISEHEAKRLCEVRDWQLAKRQITWLKRHDYVQWLALDDAHAYIDTLLRKYRDA